MRGRPPHQLATHKTPKIKRGSLAGRTNVHFTPTSASWINQIAGSGSTSHAKWKSFGYIPAVVSGFPPRSSSTVTAASPLSV
ncbi:hypothetical protein EI171_12175 [Bradyrhizobium sp. LCT2]|nr:hypothetical protein EI171_12175 [Bradyrhizobium sp. LCT2]